MRLTKVQIKKFKSIQDTGEFTIDPKVTCLVGKNESGKTAILQAIEKLNPLTQNAAGEDSFDILEYPRSEMVDFQNRESEEDVHALITTWELSDDDLLAVEEQVGEGVVNSPEIVIHRGYYKSMRWTISVNEANGISNLIDDAELHAEEQEPLRKCTNLAAVLKSLESKPAAPNPDQPGEERSSRETALITRIKSGFGEKKPAVWTAVWRVLATRVPKMVYFNDYLRMPGQVSIQDLKNRQGAKLESGNRVFMALLGLINKSPEDLESIGMFESLQAELEGISNKLTREIFTYWSQNQQLRVQFRFETGMPQDKPPFNSGYVMRTRIENKRHGVTTGFDERSTGFVWFFSFLIWFGQAKKQYGENLILLLDEPGLSLHARAQADLLRYFEKKLNSYQIIYSTHSPFMVDSTNLFRARTVEDVVMPFSEGDEIELGTKVGDSVLSTDKDTIFPLQAALGYDISQTLFIGRHTLLVEGPSELLYLPWFSRKLRSLGRSGLDQRWTLTPCGGIDKVPSFLALFSGQKLNIATLVDFAEGGKKRVRELRETVLLKSGHVLSAEQYAGQSEADVEDIIGREMYTDLVNQCYGLTLANAMPTVRPPGSSDRVVKDAELHFRTVATSGKEFDHFSPAEYLNRQPIDTVFPGLQLALDQFERLFVDLNTLIAVP